MKASNKSTKVFVAMSGGVDSSVAALLLKNKGYNVYGIFMREWTPSGIRCSETENRRMAARAASCLGIPFAVWDFRAVYETNVASYLVREYATGKTPNPDVVCNTDIKFGVFLDAAKHAGADYIATGHYIKKLKVQNSKFKTLEGLYTAKDTNKDQSYFLWTLTQSRLQHCIFPIGGYAKPQVRRLAKKFGLPNWDRKDSQGMCFVGELNFGKFLRTQLSVQEGAAVFTDGTMVGTHDGAEFYTIGQRIGIKNYESRIMGKRESLYVADKNLETNTLVVTSDDSPELFKSECAVSNVNWISGEQPTLPVQCLTRIRYRQALQKAIVYKLQTTNYKLQFDLSQRAIAPGQSAVFYSKTGEMLGGGIIE